MGRRSTLGIQNITIFITVPANSSSLYWIFIICLKKCAELGNFPPSLWASPCQAAGTIAGRRKSHEDNWLGKNSVYFQNSLGWMLNLLAINCLSHLPCASCFWEVAADFSEELRGVGKMTKCWCCRQQALPWSVHIRHRGPPVLCSHSLPRSDWVLAGPEMLTASTKVWQKGLLCNYSKTFPWLFQCRTVNQQRESKMNCPWPLLSETLLSYLCFKVCFWLWFFWDTNQVLWVELHFQHFPFFVSNLESRFFSLSVVFLLSSSKCANAKDNISRPAFGTSGLDHPSGSLNQQHPVHS